MTKQTKKVTGMRKREQIQAANKTVFLWAVLASAALALCAVVGYFLVKEIVFTGNILSAKGQTLSVLRQNIDNAAVLEQNVVGLIANNDLASVKANSSDTTYKVILDALPVSNDATVLGSSLLQELLPKSGVRVETLTTGSSDGMAVAEPVVDPETGEPIESVAAPSVSVIPFNATVSGDYQKVSRMLQDLQLSIRPINVKFFRIEGNDSNLQVSISGESYYSSEKTVTLGSEPLAP